MVPIFLLFSQRYNNVLAFESLVELNGDPSFKMDDSGRVSLFLLLSLKLNPESTEYYL